MHKLPLVSVPTILCLVASSGCGGDLCANTITSRVTAPGSARDAVVFTRDCGATTDFSTQVALVRSGGELPNVAGDVFIAPHSAQVRVEWLGPDTLLVHHAVPNPNLKAGQVDGVLIRYATP